MEHTMELLWRAKNGDKEASDLLVQENLGLVGSVVKRFENRGCEREDLFQIGSIGLMKAIEKFDFSYEVCFSTYAVPLVMGEIRRFLRDDGMVKVSRTLKENGYRIRREAEILAAKLGREATLEELSVATEMKREDIVLALEAGNEVESLHKTVFQKEGSEIPLMDRIPSERDESEIVLNRLMLEQLLDELEEKERRLIELRYFHDKTQTQVADLLDMNQVQVSRMEKKILRSMRKKFS